MATYKGLIYVRNGRLGTRSEGPDYFLQTASGDYLMHYRDRPLWEPDYQLEFFVRRMVAVEGELEAEARVIQVKHIHDLLTPVIPRESAGI